MNTSDAFVKVHFLVATGLREMARDEHLMGVLVHEVVHDDLGHGARQQVLGTGLDTASGLLGNLLPGVDQVATIAGGFALRAYGRRREYQADHHRAELLRHLGYPPQIMIGTLNWMLQTAWPSDGGFFATHPATADQIDKLRQAGG